jgi:hypothetical protein
MSIRWLACLAMSSAFMAVSARAEVVDMTAKLSGTNEVPPVQSAGGGSAAVKFDTESRKLSWEVQVQGLGTPISAAHFHGPSGASGNAGVMVPIAKSGDKSPFAGSATLTPEQAVDLLAGRWYVNIHTPAHPPGELRGQVTKK